MKKTISLVLVIVLMSSLFITAFATPARHVCSSCQGHYTVHWMGCALCGGAIKVHAYSCGYKHYFKHYHNPDIPINLE